MQAWKLLTVNILLFAVKLSIRDTLSSSWQLRTFFATALACAKQYIQSLSKTKFDYAKSTSKGRKLRGAG